MTGRNGRRILVVAACAILAGLWSYGIRRDFQGSLKMPDFSGVYFGARCVMHHKDPYDNGAYLNELKLQNPAILNELVAALKRTGVTWTSVYPPTALLVALPLAVLPYPIAANLFTIASVGFLGLGAFLVWDLGGDFAPTLCGCFAGFMLVDCIVVLILGNPAAIVVSFCMVAAWCLLKDRFAAAGVLLLALALVIKPHDAGFVWLFFLLAGGALRKRALQTLAVVGILTIVAVLWIRPVSPHWMQEENNAVAAAAMRGGLSDPGPSGATYRTHRAPILSLQAAFSIFKNDPDFYNPMSYSIVGALLLIWAAAVLRKPLTREGALLCLAVVSIVTMLPVYHRPHDAKLLLLAVPACAMLWAGGGARRWLALGLTSAMILVTGDLPIFFWTSVTSRIPVSTSTLAGKFELLALQPSSLVLLATGCFYLWVYLCYRPPAVGKAEKEHRVERTAEAAST